MVVDLDEVTFLDSTAVGALVSARAKMPNRRSFPLARPRPETMRTLEISGLAKHLGIYETLGAALTASL